MNDPKEYIERGALIDSFENCYWLYNSTDREIVRQALENAPAADVAPVVRCKECKFYEEVEYYPDGTKKICRLLKRQFHPDDFCSYGERKEE